VDGIEEFFRVDHLEERKVYRASYTPFSISLFILSFTILFYILATILFDAILEKYSLYHTLNNWYISFTIFVISKSFLGIGYILVGNFYVRLTRIIKLSKASLTSFLFTVWGIMHLYDSIILFTIWPTPDELLQMLENTTELTLYLNVFLTLIIFVALFYMGLNFIRFSSMGIVSRKLTISGTLLIIGSITYLVVSIINLINIGMPLFTIDILFYFGEIFLFMGFLIAGYFFLKAKKGSDQSRKAISP